MFELFIKKTFIKQKIVDHLLKVGIRVELFIKKTFFSKSLDEKKNNIVKLKR